MLILNEKEYAEKCLRTRSMEEKPYRTLTILAKYYYQQGYRRKRIAQLLTEFLSKCYPPYPVNRVFWDEAIDRIAQKAGKYVLHEINGVSISRNEMETIRGIHNKVLERLCFTMLCLAKLNNLKNPKNNGWVNQKTKDIFKLARISCNVTDRYKKLGALAGLGLIEFPRRNDNLSNRVTFIDNGDEVLFVDDFRELGYTYMQYCGGNFIKCAECGKIMRNNRARNKKYCSECAAYHPKEFKKVICMDCGIEFEVDSRNNQSKRCKDCYALYRRDYYREQKRKQRENQHMSTEQF